MLTACLILYTCELKCPHVTHLLTSVTAPKKIHCTNTELIGCRDAFWSLSTAYFRLNKCEGHPSHLTGF